VPDVTEFDEVVEKYSHEIFAYLWRLLNGTRDAEDCLQEVFLRAFQAFDRLGQDANIRAWLYTIATNTSISFRRKRSRVELHEFILEIELPSQEVLPEVQVEWNERLKVVLETIDVLPDRQRAALMMRKYQELSYAEISEILGCSQETARANVYQALKKLRERYSKQLSLKE
jgi:RNA polymerase sigma-70 factor (ECF subfamily)